MPDKTQGELIRELSTLGATLTERVDNLRGDIERLEAAQAKTTESLSALSTRMAILEQQLGGIRTTAEESGRRRWALLPPFLAAVIGGLLTFLGQLLLSYLRKVKVTARQTEQSITAVARRGNEFGFPTRMNLSLWSARAGRHFRLHPRPLLAYAARSARLNGADRGAAIGTRRRLVCGFGKNRARLGIMRPTPSSHGCGGASHGWDCSSLSCRFC
jgi:uncharacterized small protein (DUF1192 family)